MPHTENIATELSYALQEIAKTRPPAEITLHAAAGSDAIPSAAKP
jgi:hypothetical protein